MIIKTPFKVWEDGNQIKEFSTYEKACMFVETLEIARILKCSVYVDENELPAFTPFLR